MLGSELVGKEYEPFTFEVEKGRIRMFAHAIGETNPIYYDEAAARDAGYRSLPAPPTFPFTITMESRQPFLPIEELGVDITRSMHGEQSFTYHSDICAGDVITGRQKIVDIFEKKGGALLFIIVDTRLDNQDGRHVADLRMSIVVRNG
ncbi:MAG: MaoC family dehydratase N-terminal domain-containing protein [Rhodospirillales bacterium]|nr:MaoC family dehydratase N-terminal domain-containing protein [Rhodospirillales bacterium]